MFHRTAWYSTPKFLLISDIFGLALCWLIAAFSWGSNLNSNVPHWNSPLIWGIIILFPPVELYLADTYQLEKRLNSLQITARVVLNLVFTVGTVIAAIFLTKILLKGFPEQLSFTDHGFLILALGMFAIWAVGWRVLTLKWIRSHHRNRAWLVLGSPSKASRFERECKSIYPGAKVSYLTEQQDSGTPSQQASSCELLGRVNDLNVYYPKHTWSGVLIDSQSLSDNTINDLMKLRLQGESIHRLGDYCEKFFHKIPPEFVTDSWFAFALQGFSLNRSKFYGSCKRFFDIVMALTLLILTFPLMLFVALLIKVESPGPIIYRQVRAGKDEKLFKMYKFRSMYQGGDKSDLHSRDARYTRVEWTISSDPRITKVGSIIRKLKIDELPQLWNVLQGNMSIIGPRPEQPQVDQILAEQIPYYKCRYAVKPGLTGWTQVMFGYGNTFEDAYQKTAYDLYYVKNCSPILDLIIFFKTFRVIFLAQSL